MISYYKYDHPEHLLYYQYYTEECTLEFSREQVNLYFNWPSGRLSKNEILVKFHCKQIYFFVYFHFAEESGH